MYLFDPLQGKRRRALLRDKFIHLTHTVEDGTGVVARDLTNRTWGVAASIGRAFRHAPADDHVLEPRVRSEMGRWVSHPHAIHVDARDGCITLTGDVLASEERDLVRHVEQVPGVRKVENRLRVHENAEKLPLLQGGYPREPRFELFQTNWAPGPRLLAGISGAALIGMGVRKAGLWGLLISAGGAMLLFRAATNREISRLINRESDAGEKHARKRREEGLPAEPQASPPPSQPESPEYRIN